DCSISRRMVCAWRDHGRFVMPVYTSPPDSSETVFLKTPDARLHELAGENSVTVSNIDEAKRLVLWRAEQARQRHARPSSLSMAADKRRGGEPDYLTRYPGVEFFSTK